MRVTRALGVAALCIGVGCKHADIPPAPPIPRWQQQMSDNGFAGDVQVQKLADEYIDLVARTEPETATGWGLHVGDSELDDRSDAGESSRLAAQKALLAKVESLERSLQGGTKLSLPATTDLEVLRGILRRKIRVSEEVMPHERMPDYYTAPLGAVFVLLARDFAPEPERARSALSRLERLPDVVAAAKTNLKAPPELWVKIGIESAKGAKSFFVDVKAKLDAALPNEKSRVALAVRRADAAYVDYARFLERDVMKRATKEFAAGRSLFEFLLREDYFVTETPEQLEALGRRVFASTEAELLKTAKLVDPSAADWPQVIAKLKGNHPIASELLDTYRHEVARARAFLVEKDAVPFPKGDDCQVLETPQFLRGTIQAAYDQPPPFDAKASGLFYVTPVESTWSKARQQEWLRENAHGDIVDTSVHEAYPGHHLQLSFARLHPSHIRKVVGTAIFTEGWALYSEELMHELGYYTPEERMLVLEWTLMRAARVILDVGMHVLGASYDEAVSFLVDKVHIERSLAENEVKRYSESPTQPLSYMVGREKIFALRERYKKAQENAGKPYSLRQFHHEVLTRGTLPPALLEREMFPADQNESARSRATTPR